MNQIKQLIQQKQRASGQEKGQSIVLIALMMVGIIAFVGVAVDVGFIFARGSQLQAAIDSAALAGVVELSGWREGNINNPTLENSARTKSAQFLNANNMPISVTTSLNNPGNLDFSTTPLGATEYSVTATWPVETYFLKVIGFREPINLTRSATAAIFSLADIYVSRRIEDGALSTSNQGIFGPASCTHMGDAFSPISSAYEPGPYTYTYRIYIPPNYEQNVGNVVRVELFDPDSINTDRNSSTIDYTQRAQSNGLGPQATKTCGTDGGSSARYQPCLVRTDELTLVGDDIELDQINPYWFVRIDENRMGPGGDGRCQTPTSYAPVYNTQTRYSLSYFAQNPDGTIEKIPLVTYFGQVGDDDRDNGNHQTDLHWVSPGADIPFSTVDDPRGDYTIPVPAVAQNIDSFEVDLTTDVSNIVADQSTGARYIYLDVQAMSGASENGFEVWAGPPTYVNDVPSEVNSRNRHVLDFPGSHSSRGVTIYGVGNLPMNSNFAGRVDVPLMYVGPDMIDQEIVVSLFDPDSGASPPVVLYFDSIAFTPDDDAALGYDPAGTDWAQAFHVNGQTDPNGTCTMLEGNSCDDKRPIYTITVPGNVDNCDYNNPTMADCTPFYGGRLTMRYGAGFSDTYGLQISVEGLPYLVR